LNIEDISQETLIRNLNVNSLENITISENNERDNRVGDIEFSSTGNVNMSNESKLNPKVHLRCPKEEDKIIEKGICKDVCDFPKFKLNRLQHFEPKIFSFKAKHTQPYSRQCEEPRRPIVMAYDPATNPKINKDSYTYSIKYKSTKDGPVYNYICPQAWCPTCEVPIPLEKLKDIKIKNTKDGICEYAKCPNGKHDVLINRSGINEIYPGFLNPGGNPNGLCMPCCFKNDKLQSLVYKRCVQLKTDVDDDLEDLGQKYINRREKIPLNEGRYGLLPEELEIFLGGGTCYSGNIKMASIV
jgi:hypothetical protein